MNDALLLDSIAALALESGHISPHCMSNPEHKPELFGLRVVDEIDYSDQSYSFDTRIVWKDENGRLFTARDSGCSCPEPFEDYTTLQSLDTFNWLELQNEVDAELKAEFGVNITPLQAREFLNAIESALSNSPSQNA